MRESHDAFGSPCFVDGPDGAVYSGRLEPTLQLSYTVMLPYRKPLPVLGNSFAAPACFSFNQERCFSLVNILLRPSLCTY